MISVIMSDCVQDCQGHAPNYVEGTRGNLREMLYVVRHLFHEAMGPLRDGRTGQDLLPGLLQGRALRRHLLDFSAFHTAVLWLGPSIVAAGAASPGPDQFPMNHNDSDQRAPALAMADIACTPIDVGR